MRRRFQAAGSGQIDVMAHDEARSLEGGAQDVRRLVVQRDLVQRRAQVAAMQRRALAAHVGQPHREIVGREVEQPVVGVGAEPASGAVEEETAGVARTAEHRLAWCRVRDSPEARAAPPSRRPRPR